MPNAPSDKFPMPELGWATVKKIIRAYYAKRESPDLKVQDVAEAANLSRPLVSSNNNFLKAIGVLEQDSYKLTPFGTELALAVVGGDEETERECLKRIVESCQPLKKLFDIVMARGEISARAFNTQVYLVLGIDEKDRRAKWVSTVLEILIGTGLIRIDDDLIHPELGVKRQLQASRANSPPDTKMQAEDSLQGGAGLRRIPIPVGANSVWYVEVEQGADQEQIKKFLEVQKLIFDMKD